MRTFEGTVFFWLGSCPPTYTCMEPVNIKKQNLFLEITRQCVYSHQCMHFNFVLIWNSLSESTSEVMIVQEGWNKTLTSGWRLVYTVVLKINKNKSPYKTVLITNISVTITAKCVIHFFITCIYLSWRHYTCWQNLWTNKTIEWCKTFECCCLLWRFDYLRYIW